MAVRIGRKVAALSDSLTLAIDARYKAMVQAGEDAVSFGTGEPDFPTPAPVCEAGIKAVRDGFTKYTPSSGLPELRKAVAEALARDSGAKYEPSQVVITGGAKQAVYEALATLTDDGDEVLIPSPYWLSYPEMAVSVGAKPVFIPCSEEDGWRLRPEALERAAGPRARVLILNSPGNPTGAVFSREDLQGVAEVCRAKDLAVVSDEIYDRMVYDGARNVCFASLSPDALGRTVTVGGVSKTYAMTGWRIGWAAGPKAVMGPFGNLQSHLTSNAAAVCQKAALAALTGDQSTVDAMVAAFDERRKLVVRLLAAIPGVKLAPPRGSFYVFVRVDGFYGRRPGLNGSVAFCESLLEERKVACVPGSAFGDDRYIRLSYATSTEKIEKGCRRIREFVEGLGGRA
jgi:aspartate aminotransferase